MVAGQDRTPSPASSTGEISYSVSRNASQALKLLFRVSSSELPVEFAQYVQDVVFEARSATGDSASFPSPLRQQEACAALKALEGCAVSAIANLSAPGKKPRRKITIDLERVACYLMSAYITTLDDLDKSNPKISRRLPGWFAFFALCAVY
jgi:hypothetical protein